WNALLEIMVRTDVATVPTAGIGASIREHWRNELTTGIVSVRAEEDLSALVPPIAGQFLERLGLIVDSDVLIADRHCFYEWWHIGDALYGVILTLRGAGTSLSVADLCYPAAEFRLHEIDIGAVHDANTTSIDRQMRDVASLTRRMFG